MNLCGDEKMHQRQDICARHPRCAGTMAQRFFRAWTGLQATSASETPSVRAIVAFVRASIHKIVCNEGARKSYDVGLAKQKKAMLRHTWSWSSCPDGPVLVTFTILPTYGSNSSHLSQKRSACTIPPVSIQKKRNLSMTQPKSRAKGNTRKAPHQVTSTTFQRAS